MTRVGRIAFRFDAEKFVNAVAFLAQRVRDLDKLKAAKLLFFADKYHLLRYGRPIIGDRYHSLDYGPVPSQALDIMNETIHDSPSMVRKRPFRDLFESYVSVERGHRYPRFRPKRDADLDIFSESEIEALDHTVAQYGKKTGGALIDLSHKEPVWKAVQGYGEIDYRLFFGIEPASAKAGSELLEADQEVRDLVDAINGI